MMEENFSALLMAESDDEEQLENAAVIKEMARNQRKKNGNRP